MLKFKLLLTTFLFGLHVGCSNPLEDQLLEVNRLDELRNTVGEILMEQKSNVEAEIQKFNSSDKLEEDRVIDIRMSLRKAEGSLKYWENWHIEEEKKRKWHAQNNRDINAATAEMDLNTAKYELHEALVAKSRAAVGVNYLQAVDNVTLKKVKVVRYERLMAQYKSNEIALVYEKPKRRDAKIRKLKSDIAAGNRNYDRAKKALELNRRRFRNRIAKMNADLKTTLATYDSVTAMHKNTVLALSKIKK